MKTSSALLLIVAALAAAGGYVLYKSNTANNPSPSRDGEKSDNPPPKPLEQARVATGVPRATRASAGGEVDDLFPDKLSGGSGKTIAKYQPDLIKVVDEPVPFVTSGSTEPKKQASQPIAAKKSDADVEPLDLRKTAERKAVAGYDVEKWGVERAVYGLVSGLEGVDLAVASKQPEKLGLPREVPTVPVAAPWTRWDLAKQFDKLSIVARKFEAEYPPSTTSLRIPTEDPARTAKLVLSNEYAQEMSIVVNGVGYRLAPGGRRVVSLPAGPYTFQVLQLQTEPQRREIVAGEERPLRIYDRR